MTIYSDLEYYKKW